MLLPKLLCVLLPVFISIDVISGFILGSQCIAPPPCTCLAYDVVSCERNQLLHVPSFSEQEKHSSTLTISLGWNNITRIPANSFKNLSSFNATQIDIDLQSNRLNQIDMGAFSGIQAGVGRLNLKQNSLTYLPSGLNELTNLLFLYIDGNPLTSLDATTMSKLGHTLQVFTLSVGHFSAFPNELHFLKKIIKLVINNIPFSRLSHDAFQGVGTSLYILEMSKSKLVKIPAAICHLRRLTKLTFNQSQNLTKDDSIFENCNDTMHALSILILDDDKLSTFPDVFNLFPNLDGLSLQLNNLQLIPNNSVTHSSTFSALLLSGNNFARIPTAITKLVNITSLNITYNNIVSIGDVDLMQFRRLEELDLSGNPLAHVSPNAFKHNLLLENIYFDHTMLTRVPIGLVGLPNLAEVSINSSPIECSCSAMAYLKSWNVNTISLLGNCTTGEGLKTYLTNKLPKCP